MLLFAGQSMYVRILQYSTWVSSFVSCHTAVLSCNVWGIFFSKRESLCNKQPFASLGPCARDGLGLCDRPSHCPASSHLVLILHYFLCTLHIFFLNAFVLLFGKINCCPSPLGRMPACELLTLDICRLETLPCKSCQYGFEGLKTVSLGCLC